jgi:signal transduction histidine kinase
MTDAAKETEKKDALLSQGAHEVRNAISVIIGWARMLSGDRLGPLSDSQRKAAVEIVNSAAKLKNLADEMSQLSRLLAGGMTLTRTRVEVAPLIAAQIPSVPAALDGDISIRVIDNAPAAAIDGDAELLGLALNGLMFAHRRELFTGNELCVAIDRMTGSDRPGIRLTIGGADRLADVRRLPPAELEPLVEVRGGVGFKLSIARHLIERHGGLSLSKTEPAVSRDGQPTLVGAVVILPEAS